MNKNIGIFAVFLTLGLLAAIGVRALLRETPTLPPATALASPAQPAISPMEISANTSTPAAFALQQEIAAREQLALTVARLEKEIDELKLKLAPPRTAPAVDSKSTRPAPPASDAGGDAEATDEQLLRDAGLSSTQVAQIKERYEQLEMDRLYLRDRATREGWMGTVRYSNEVAKLEENRQGVRNDLGDEGYDAYLFASGQSNRVLIREMLQGSPAKQAGLQAGDVVLRYGDKRIFTTRELQNATAGGRNGEMVPMEIQRDGKSMDFYVPRGPLGVYLDNDSVQP